MNLASLLDGAPRIVITFFQANTYSGMKDCSRVAILLPLMVWERAEKVLAILGEHGASRSGASWSPP